MLLNFAHEKWYSKCTCTMLNFSSHWQAKKYSYIEVLFQNGIQYYMYTLLQLRGILIVKVVFACEISANKRIGGGKTVFGLMSRKII